MLKSLCLGFALSVISLNSWALGPDSIKTIIPSKTILHPFYLYKDWTYDNAKDQVNVVGQTFLEKDGQLVQSSQGIKFSVPLNDFIFYRQMAQGVFEVVSEVHNKAGTSSSFSGTAFLVGPNLMLSNNHVVHPQSMPGVEPYVESQDPTSCPIYVTADPAKREISRCEEVIYCDDEVDFCLIRMGQTTSGKSLNDISPMLSLASRELPKENKDEAMYVLGNHDARGLQLGMAYGYKHLQADDPIEEFENKNAPTEVFLHYTPTLVGSSGSPLFNSQGEVLALNFGALASASSPNVNYTEDAVNLGVPMSYILKKLKTKLTPEMFGKLNIDIKPSSENLADFKSEWKKYYNRISSDKSSFDQLVNSLRNNDLGNLKKKTEASFLAGVKELSVREALSIFKLYHPIGAFEDRLAFLLAKPPKVKDDIYIACSKAHQFTRTCLAKVMLWKLFRDSPLEKLDWKTLDSIGEVIKDKVTFQDNETEIKQRLRSTIMTDRRIGERLFMLNLAQVKKINLKSEKPLFDDNSILGKTDFGRNEFKRLLGSFDYQFPESLTEDDIEQFFISYVNTSAYEMGYLSQDLVKLLKDRSWKKPLRKRKNNELLFRVWAEKRLELLTEEERSFDLFRAEVIK